MGHTENVAAEIVAERERQKAVEGWTPEHDDAHKDGQLADAAGCYALYAAAEIRVPGMVGGHPAFEWPWERAAWNPKGPRRDLIRAAALIVAEIERIDRAARAANGGAH